MIVFQISVLVVSTMMFGFSTAKLRSEGWL
jgi:hypothetical protein